MVLFKNCGNKYRYKGYSTTKKNNTLTSMVKFFQLYGSSFLFYSVDLKATHTQHTHTYHNTHTHIMKSLTSKRVRVTSKPRAPFNAHLS